MDSSVAVEREENMLGSGPKQLYMPFQIKTKASNLEKGTGLRHLDCLHS